MSEANILRVPDPVTHEHGGMVLVPDPYYALDMLEIMAELDADLGPVLGPLVAHREELRAEVERRSPDELAQCVAVAARTILTGEQVKDPVVCLLLFHLP